MEYGWSVRLQDYVHAREVDYGDCETFTILCANEKCREAVHKVGSEITKRQYLAHYPKQGHVDCELRVRQIARERQGGGSFVHVPHGQELESFMARFEFIVMEQFHDNTPEGRRFIRAIDKARDRTYWRHIVRELRPDYRVLCRGEEGNPHYADHAASQTETPEWRQGLRDVLTFLTADNSWRATLFAATYGLSTCGLLMEQAHREAESNLFADLMFVNDRNLRNIYAREGRNLATQIAISLAETAVTFMNAITTTLTPEMIEQRCEESLRDRESKLPEGQVLSEAYKESYRVSFKKNYRHSFMAARLGVKPY